MSTKYCVKKLCYTTIIFSILSVVFSVFGLVKILGKCDTLKGQVSESICYNQMQNVYCNYTIEMSTTICKLSNIGKRQYYIYEILILCKDCSIPSDSTLWYVFLILGVACFLLTILFIILLCYYQRKLYDYDLEENFQDLTNK